MLVMSRSSLMYVLALAGQELKQELMNPYLQNVGAKFKHGVNFASSGSTACNSSYTGDGSDSGGLFSLFVQADQFRAFHQVVLLEDANLGTCCPRVSP